MAEPLRLGSNIFQHLLCVSDDGKLSFEEFNAYFADGILTTEELQELFYSIDGRQNKWVLSFNLGLGRVRHVNRLRGSVRLAAEKGAQQ